jgi:hypothetical protein
MYQDSMIRGAMGDRVGVLPEGTVLADALDLCRWAILEFMAGTQRGWGKRELAKWLAGSYFDATRLVATEAELSAIPSARTVCPTRLDDVIAQARKEARTLIVECSRSWCDISFARPVVESRLVEGAVDASGERGYLPVNLPRASLSLRIRSLIIADYLSRPLDYLGSVTECEDCGEVSFDWAPNQGGCCQRHGGPQSMVVRRKDSAGATETPLLEVSTG